MLDTILLHIPQTVESIKTTYDLFLQMEALGLCRYVCLYCFYFCHLR